MGLADAIERLKNIVYSKSSKDRSEFGSNSRGFENYDPTRFYYMNCGDNGSYVDVECIATEEFIRVYGVDFDMQCSDFLVRLCSLSGLEAVDYTFLVPCEGLSGVSGIFWLSAPSRSRLGHWVNSDTTQTTLPSMVRLIAKCCFKKSAKLYQYPFLDTKFKYPITLLKTGREFLNELGHRITVHLPEDCTIVVRGHLDQPISKVLQKVSSERHVQLSNYYITDPQKGTILDPKDTFLNQNADQIELKERKVKSSKNSKSHKKSQNDDSLISNLEVEISTESKHKRRPAPSVPAKQQITHRHLSPFADVPDKVQSSSCVTLPSKKNDNKKLDDKRNSVVGSQANRDSISNCSQELRSKSFIVKDKSNSHKRKSSTMVNSNTKKESEKKYRSPAPPPPPPPPQILPSLNKPVNGNDPNMPKSTHKDSRKSDSHLLKTDSRLDDEFIKEGRKSNKGSAPKNHSQEIVTKPSVVDVVNNQSNSHEYKPSTTMTSITKKESEKKYRSPAPPPPPPPPQILPSLNKPVNGNDPNMPKSTHKDSRKSDSHLLKTDSRLDDEFIKEGRKSNKGSAPKNHSQEIVTKPSVVDVVNNQSNSHEYKPSTTMTSITKKESEKECRSAIPPPPPPPSPPPPPPAPSSLQRNSTMRANYSDPSLKDSGVKPVRRLSTTVSYNYKHNLKSPSIEMLTELTDAFKSLKKSTNIIDAKNVDFSKKLPVHRGRIKSAIRQNSSDTSNNAHDKSNNVMPSVIESDDCCSVDTSS
ncbi:unnamed protein product [Schistosoma curassoni]|nr:unnamed protein product [Schistosoma curassoni]